MTLNDYTKKMIEDFKAKPEYKSYQDKQTGTENYELKEVGGKTYKFNQATGSYEVISG